MEGPGTPDPLTLVFVPLRCNQRSLGPPKTSSWHHIASVYMITLASESCFIVVCGNERDTAYIKCYLCVSEEGAIGHFFVYLWVR